MWSRGEGEKPEESAGTVKCEISRSEDDHRKRGEDSVHDTVRLAIYSGLLLLAYLCF